MTSIEARIAKLEASQGTQERYTCTFADGHVEIHHSIIQPLLAALDPRSSLTRIECTAQPPYNQQQTMLFALLRRDTEAFRRVTG